MINENTYLLKKNRDYSSFLTEIIEDFVFSKKYLDLTIVTLIFDFLKNGSKMTFLENRF